MVRAAGKRIHLTHIVNSFSPYHRKLYHSYIKVPQKVIEKGTRYIWGVDSF